MSSVTCLIYNEYPENRYSDVMQGADQKKHILRCLFYTEEFKIRHTLKFDQSMRACTSCLWHASCTVVPRLYFDSRRLNFSGRSVAASLIKVLLKISTLHFIGILVNFIHCISLALTLKHLIIPEANKAR